MHAHVQSQPPFPFLTHTFYQVWPTTRINTQSLSHIHWKTESETNMHTHFIPIPTYFICMHILQQTHNYLSIPVSYHSLIYAHCSLSRFVCCLSLSPSTSGERSALTRRPTGLSERERGEGEARWSTVHNQPAKFENAFYVWKWRAVSDCFYGNCGLGGKADPLVIAGLPVQFLARPVHVWKCEQDTALLLVFRSLPCMVAYCHWCVRMGEWRLKL